MGDLGGIPGSWRTVSQDREERQAKGAGKEAVSLLLAYVHVLSLD